MSYILDTNTVIYYLQKQFHEKARDFVNNLLAKETPHLSVISEIELLCWKNDSEKDMEVLKNFINGTKIIDSEREIKLKTVEIRRSIAKGRPQGSPLHLMLQPRCGCGGKIAWVEEFRDFLDF